MSDYGTECIHRAQEGTQTQIFSGNWLHCSIEIQLFDRLEFSSHMLQLITQKNVINLI